MTIDEIIADFELLDDWEDRYRYIIDLGRSLAPLPDLARTEGNKVQGCVSQVWLQTSVGDGPDPDVQVLGDSDAHIVKGLVAIILALYSGKRASEISTTDAEALMKQLGGVFRYTELPGTGHDSWQGAFGDPDLMPWLLAQRR